MYSSGVSVYAVRHSSKRSTIIIYPTVRQIDPDRRGDGADDNYYSLTIIFLRTRRHIGFPDVRIICLSYHYPSHSRLFSRFPFFFFLNRAWFVKVKPRRRRIVSNEKRNWIINSTSLLLQSHTPLCASFHAWYYTIVFYV